MLSWVFTMALVNPHLCAAPHTTSEQLALAQNTFQYGDYETAITMLEQIRDASMPLSRHARETLFETLGLAYFLTQQKSQAEQAFSELLRISPGYTLDPFTVSPDAISLFEGLKKSIGPRAKTKVDLSGSGFIITRTIDTTLRSDAWTYLPFGVGQFHNGHRSLGLALAVGQTLFLATNIGVYLWQRNLKTPDGQTGYATSQIRDVELARTLQLTSAMLFGASWAFGSIHARMHFQPILRTEGVEVRSADEKASGSAGAGLQFQLQW